MNWRRAQGMISPERGRLWDLGVVVASLLTVAAGVLLWQSPLLLPIKLFVVLLHELSHGLAAILTGGSMERVALTADEGGLAFTRSGNRFVILNAGYLGSALLGALLMRMAWAGGRLRGFLLRAMGIILLAILVLYVRDPFSLLYVAAAALAIYSIGRWAGAHLQMVILWLVGTFSCLYALVDIGTDVLSHGPLAGLPLLGGPPRFNDAELLASITFIPAFIWGLVWSVITLLIYALSLFLLLRRRGR